MRENTQSWFCRNGTRRQVPTLKIGSVVLLRAVLRCCAALLLTAGCCSSCAAAGLMDSHLSPLTLLSRSRVFYICSLLLSLAIGDTQVCGGGLCGVWSVMGTSEGRGVQYLPVVPTHDALCVTLTYTH